MLEQCQNWWWSESVSPGGIPVASCLSRRLSEVSKWIWLKILYNYCLCLGAWSLWEFARALWEQSFWCPQFSGSLYTALHLSGAGPLEPDMWLGPFTPWGEPLQLWWSFPLWVTSLGCGSWLYYASTPPTYLIIVPSLYLEKKVKVLVAQSCPALWPHVL